MYRIDQMHDKLPVINKVDLDLAYSRPHLLDLTIIVFWGGASEPGVRFIQVIRFDIIIKQ